MTAGFPHSDPIEFPHHDFHLFRQGFILGFDHFIHNSGRQTVIRTGKAFTDIKQSFDRKGSLPRFHKAAQRTLHSCGQLNRFNMRKHVEHFEI